MRYVLEKYEENIRPSFLVDEATMPAVPPKPADFAAPAPHRYSCTLKPLLNLGWQLDESALAPHLSRRGKWRKVLPELSQMATDPGLVNGLIENENMTNSQKIDVL